MLFSFYSTFYNNNVFNEHIKRSIQEQEYSDFEFIPIDNSNNKYLSAAAAYNRRAFEAKGKYLVFVHQDVRLYSPRWISVLEKLVSFYNFGIAGCSGVSAAGEKLGFIKDRKTIWGKPFCAPQEAQTVDEALLIIPKDAFVELGGFAPELGWHSYGTDLSIKLARKGKKILILPLFIWHNSPSSLAGVENILWRIYKRYGKVIHTTSGKTEPAKLVLNSFKAHMPVSIKKILVYLLSGLGLEKEKNILSYKIRKRNRFLLIDLLEENYDPSMCILPEKIKIERLSNNPLWHDKSIDYVILKNKNACNRFFGLTTSGQGIGEIIVAERIKQILSSNKYIELIPLTKNYALVKRKGH